MTPPQASYRTCGVEGCTTRHKRTMLMCRRHWLGLPKAIRDEHWRVCREHGIPSDEWAESAEACFAYWSDDPAGDMHEPYPVDRPADATDYLPEP